MSLTCTHCQNSITRAIYAHQYCSEYCRLLHVDALTLCLADQERGSEKYAFLMEKLISSWTLREYLAFLNQPNPDPNVITFPMVGDLSHWAGYGITTAPQLADYMDGCCEKEMRKDMDAWEDKFTKLVG